MVSLTAHSPSGGLPLATSKAIVAQDCQAVLQAPGSVSPPGGDVPGNHPAA